MHGVGRTQIQDLNTSSVHFHRTGDGGEGCEFVAGGCSAMRKTGEGQLSR